MKGKIYARDANWADAKEMVKKYTKHHGQNDQSATDLMFGVSEGELAAKKAMKAYQAGLWTACMEDATQALVTATHSVELRQIRSDCALAAGDVEASIGDQMSVIFLLTTLRS